MSRLYKAEWAMSHHDHRQGWVYLDSDKNYDYLVNFKHKLLSIVCSDDMGDYASPSWDRLMFCDLDEKYILDLSRDKYVSTRESMPHYVKLRELIEEYAEKVGVLIERKYKEVE